MENEKLNFYMKFDELFDGAIPRHFLNYCIYSISQNDPAHDLYHVLGVCKTGIQIFDHYQPVFNLTERDKLIVMMACLLHDIGCRYQRKYHHITGHGLVYEYIHKHWPGEFNEQELACIAQCVLEHRSSGRFKPTSFLSEIVSVADTGAPDIDLYISRAIMFRLSGADGEYNRKEDILYEVERHLIDKFGEEGYHWRNYPEIGRNYFKEEWDLFLQQLSCLNLIKEKINTLYDTFYQSSWSIMK